MYRMSKFLIDFIFTSLSPLHNVSMARDNKEFIAGRQRERERGRKSVELMAATTRNGKWIDADGSQIAGRDGWIAGWEQRARERTGVPVAVLEDTNARFDISQVRRDRRLLV